MNGGDEGWWLREVMNGGDEGWWLREVVTKGSGCRSQCNGCMIVVMFCCHVRRYMRVCHVVLQNAL